MGVSIFMEGLILQAGLIFALGAQNVFIMESGLKRQYPVTVSFACFFCDLLLIMLGVAGAASLFNSYPELKIGVGLLGAVFLFHYGVGKIFWKEETKPEQEVLGVEKGLRRSLLLAVTFSILNPHAYLDAFVLIGGFSAKYEVLQERLWLGLGAATYSLIWFLLLSGASSYLKPFFTEPKRMRVLMSVAGVCLVFLSVKLSLDVYSWMIEGGMSQKISHALNYPQSPGVVFTAIMF